VLLKRLEQFQSDDDRKKVSDDIAQAEINRAKDDLLYYLENLVFTLDEHDPNAPVKHLPMDKEYLRELAKLFLSEKLMLVEKSRQMLVTWVMIACHLWDAQFHMGRRIFFQSKKENDANALVDRAKHIYDSYPDYIKPLIEAQYPANKPMSYLKLEFGKNKSLIQGTPQGADVIRQYTSSRIFSDEFAFQEKAEEAFIAAKPSLVGGGSFIGVSTPNFKNFFYLLKADLV
jgi:phage FluMu gp28-like protein